MKSLAIITCGLVGVALAVPAAPAQAGSQWKVVKRLGGNNYQVAASGRDSGWAFGTDGQGRRAAYRWDGRRWSRSKLPKAPPQKVLDQSVVLIGGPGQEVSAASARNAWALVPGQVRFGDVEVPEQCAEPGARRRAVARAAAARKDVKIVTASQILRWNGSRWVVGGLVKNAFITSVVARGKKEAWASGFTATGPVTYRFDGRRWHRAKVPFGASVAASSGKYLWAQGEDAQGVPILLRHDGRIWTKLPLTGFLPPYVYFEKGKDAVFPSIDGIAVTGSKVSVTASVWRGPWCAASGKASEESFILHRRGGTWKPERPAFLKQWRLRGLTPDGRGGLYAPASGRQGIKTTLLHRTASGRWTREAIPKGADLFSFVRIPGTRTFWAVTNDDPFNNVIMLKTSN